MHSSAFGSVCLIDTRKGRGQLAIRGILGNEAKTLSLISTSELLGKLIIQLTFLLARVGSVLTGRRIRVV